MLYRFLAFCFFIFAAQSVRPAVLIPLNANWKHLKGFSEASSPDPTFWRSTNFNDTTWATAPAPFWYGDAQPSPGTQLSDMRNAYSTLFLRRAFVVTNVAEISELQLGAQSDDGFIAWINGREVGRFNVPDGEIAFDGIASPALAEPIPFQTQVLSSPRSYLMPGTNWLAVQALNASLTQSSDFVINLSLSSVVDQSAPQVSGLIPAAAALVRSLTSIEVQFNEGVSGVDAADLVINGTPATNLLVFNSAQYVFEFAQPSTGAVSVAWRSAHNIRDLAGNPNPFAGGGWNYTLDPNAREFSVMINEFLADNNNTLNDEDGQASDWIEIYNAGTNSLNLAGWYLTDEAGRPRKWRFPNVSLLANSYLVVFASNKNRTNSAAPLHTNFRLNKDGSYLALLDPQTNVVSAFAPAFPPQMEDVSYGRERFNPNLSGYFPVPTPGAANSSGGVGFAPEVRFSQPGGTFANPFSLVLSTPSASAEIRYTLDGTVPTQSSLLYRAAIQISGPLQVRARAFEVGLLPGAPRSENYLQLAANVINFNSDLPLVVIYNYGAGAVPANSDQFAYMAIYEPVAGRSSLTNRPVLSTRAGINIRGSSTAGYPKSSFAVEWWDEFNDDRKHPVLGMPSESDWILYAPNNFEPVLIHNPFIFDVSNQIGRYATRTRFVEVYLNTAGGALSSANYNGIYVLEEKIKRGDDRVAVDKLEPQHLTAPSVTGGYILKVDRLDPGDSGFGAAGQTIAYVDPKEPEIELPQRDPQEQYIRNYMASFGTALNSASFTNLATGYPAFVEVDAWIDHHLLNVMAFNVDALRLSAYFYKERNGKLSFGPIWDFDRALGSTDGRDSNPRVWRSQSGDLGTDFFNHPWWGRMFQDPDFWQRYIDRWQGLRQAQLSTTNLNARIDYWANIVRQAQPREQSRWGVIPRAGSYQAEVSLMKSWLVNRVHFMDTNFLARPNFNRPDSVVTPGTQVTLSGPAGATIYYTLDGTDPRLRGGAVSSTALAYTGPITVTTTRTILARARNVSHANLTGPNNPPLSTPWSGVNRVRLSTDRWADTGSLAVTEIQFNPAPPTASELLINPAFVNEDFEFIELKNVTNTVVDFYDARFTRGIDFHFSTSSIVTLPPGTSLLLVKNLQAFNARHGSRTNIAGVYAGSLDNSGDSLRLEMASGAVLLDFSYEGDWYPTTAGHGFSLVTTGETNLNRKTAWRPSAVAGGSPGTSDPSAGVLMPVVIHEALTHTDLPQVDTVELFNAGSSPAEVGGWFLTDDTDLPRKYRIPDGTTIGPGEFLLLNETNFNADPNAATSFGLSSLGDRLYLFSAETNGTLRWYAHGFDFGASVNGATFGRHLTSEGKEHFVTQITPTLGATNSGPLVGPVVINEIMSHPADWVVGTNRVNNTEEEFIELHNLTDGAVPLFDPAHPTNTWKLREAVDYVFPENVTLPPRGYVLLVSFDPGFDLALLNGFRTRHGLSTNVLILGPFQGRLDNGSDRIELLKPDLPQQAPAPDAGFVPYVLADRVRYSNGAPWPASGGGSNNFSLQRIDAAAFGDEPTNWLSMNATAAARNAGSIDPDPDGDGLPSSWELLYQLDPNSNLGEQGAAGDPDGDGQSNRQEFLAGTGPRDPASHLRINSVSSFGPTRIRFQAVAGKSYRLHYREEIGIGSWQLLTNLPPQGVTREIEVMDGTATGGRRFYRLETP